MALVIPKISTNDPTSSLSAALKDFEATLDRDQKTQFYAANTKPDTSSVISFVGRLDENARGKNRTGVSSRLVTFLDALRQFTGVVDTFVSSYPNIAALVWGGVKTTILAASNISSFFGKVTTMIMEIGKFCPAYTSFGHLYPDSVELQNALCEYYAAVIRLCTKIIAVLQRSAVSHALSSVISPFESEFSAHITQLREGAELVKLQSTYAANNAAHQAEKLAAEERKSNKKLRLNIRKEQVEAQDWRLYQSRREISKLRDGTRDRLSTLSSLKAYRRVLQQRVPGTAEWVLKDNAFCQWRDDRSSAVLWCLGKMGAGKTVLMSSMVEQLHISRRPIDIIAHHFCFSDHDASLKARNIMGSIARQILDGWLQSTTVDQLRALYGELVDMDSIGITGIISDRLLASQSYHIVLDGIDECGTDEARELVRCLSQLCRMHQNVKIALASRPETNKVLYRGLSIKYKIPVLEVRTRSDMRCYIDTTLDQRLEDEKLVLNEPSIILEISDKLERESQGMFLWVRLFIDDLCDQKSDHDILAALQGPPPSISRLVDRKMERVQQRSSSKEVLKLLQFCGVLKRPLTVLEFRELLSLTTSQRSRDAGQMVHDVGEVVADTGGLISIDEEEQTVHYIHQSIKNHLFDTSQPREGFCTPQLDLHLGFLMLIYLDFNDFKRSLVKASPGSSTSFRPVDMAMTVFTGSNSHVLRAAQKLLRNRTNFQQLRGKELERKIRETVGTVDQPQNQVELQYPFLDYARSYWLDHLEEINPTSDTRIWSLFDKLVKGENGLVDTPWNFESEVHLSKHLSHENTARILNWALSNHKLALVMYELVHNTETMKEIDQLQILAVATPNMLFHLMSVLIRQRIPSSGVIYPAVVVAAAYGLIDCIDLYIQQGFNLNEASYRDQRNPLQAAAGGGHLEVVDRLITAKADVNAAAPSEGRTALQAAAEGGHLEIVDRLIAAKADVNAAPATYRGYTALQAAAKGGCLEIVDRLIAAKADINAAAATTEFGGRTALQAAAEAGHLEVVNRLITMKADVDAAAAKSGGRTALQAAAGEGHLEVVDRLITAKADVNATGKRTALQAAAEGGHLEVVDRLITAKADVNAAGERTALQAAAGEGHLEVVDRLITAKADVNAAAKGGGGRTALQAAAERGHLETVDRLITAKADINAAAHESGGRTALQAAAGGGHLEIVDRLITAKADVNAAAARSVGCTALQAAAKRGHVEVVKRLKDAGARS